MIHFSIDLLGKKTVLLSRGKQNKFYCIVAKHFNFKISVQKIVYFMEISSEKDTIVLF